MHEMTTTAIGNTLIQLHRKAIDFGIQQPPSLHLLLQWDLPNTPEGDWRKEIRGRQVPIASKRWANHPQRVAGVLTEARRELRAAGPPPGIPKNATVIASSLLNTDIAVDTEGSGRHLGFFSADAVDIDGKVYQIRTAERALRHGELVITERPEPGYDHFVGHEQLAELFDLGPLWP
ncbi:hypothetical protein AB0M43_14530 [Longispora sp. NPDC051575]|uniref:hypothetical protein n=1 Tax=Longispora sp. NPDC051575 TaxID=3154943 RepID=UPI0034303F1E